MDTEADLFYRQLPKVELHAHLNGSVSFETMETLIKRKPHLIEHRMTAILSGQRRALHECFQVFKVIHQLVDSEEDILMVAKAVIQEFAADGVKYLELRSTPREVTETGLTKQRYIETIRQCKREEVDIDVRFLVAVDRRHGPEVAMDTVKLAEDFLLSSDGIVVGLDLISISLILQVGHGKYLLSALEKAKNCGLKLALHLSEVRAHGNVCKQNIPIGKSFPLSNGAFKHHFQYWYKRGHPCVLCTDDKGVFCTDLSQEYQLAASTFGLTQETLWMLSQQSIGYTFAPEPIKQRLEKKWVELKQQILQ
uniref:Adenosine deaminase-like n=1 Tax=Sinocyclocheilus rhinocerous TaxID=307959 RepID=A0A673JHM7_9TELE